AGMAMRTVPPRPPVRRSSARMAAPTGSGCRSTWPCMTPGGSAHCATASSRGPTAVCHIATSFTLCDPMSSAITRRADLSNRIHRTSGSRATRMPARMPCSRTPWDGNPKHAPQRLRSSRVTTRNPCVHQRAASLTPRHAGSNHRRVPMDGLVEVAPLPPVPRYDCFTSRVPHELRARVVPGMRVRVPLGRQTRIGVVAGFADAIPAGALRAVLDCVDPDPLLSPELLELCRWTARYYLVALADVLGTIVPARLPEPAHERVVALTRRLEASEEAALARRAPARARAYRLLAAADGAGVPLRDARAAGVTTAALRALVQDGLAESRRAPRPRSVPPAQPAQPGLMLTTEQRAAADTINTAGRTDRRAPRAAHGVTGSGKTEVFLPAADATLAAGRDVLILVPEIALTHQVVERVTARFGDRVAGG